MLFEFDIRNSRLQTAFTHLRRRGLRSLLLEMRNDVKGVAAVEFALLAPVLFAFLLGFFAVYDGLAGSKAVDHGATVVVDLVTRNIEMDDHEFGLQVAISKSLLGNYANGSDFTLVVTSVENEFDTKNDPTLTVGWSKSNIASKVLKDKDLANYDIPSIPEGGSVILLSIGIKYTPLVSTEGLSVFKFSRNVIRRPRFVDKIPYSDK